MQASGPLLSWLAARDMVHRCFRKPGTILEELWKLCKVSGHGKALHILYAGDGLFCPGPHVLCTLWQHLLCVKVICRS